MADAENSAKRKVGRPFLPGESGNPGGRPKGPSIRNALIRVLSEEDAEEIARTWVRDSKRGKMRHTDRVSLTDQIDGKAIVHAEITGSLSLGLSGLDEIRRRARGDDEE